MDTQRLKSLKILVIGDYCTDVFKYGSCKRLSPEAPVPIFSYEREVRTEGMAGNVYNNLLALKVQTDLIVSNKDSIKERFVDSKSKQHLIRADYEVQNKEIILDCELSQYDAIILSDYIKGSIGINTLIGLKNFDGPIFVDSKDPNLVKFISFKKLFIKINEEERNRLQNAPPNCNFIVTLGDKGAVYKDKIYPTKKVEVFDVSGAGDSFMSGLVVQYLLNRCIEDAILFANSCATNVVSKSGTSIINFEEVKNDLRF